MARTVLIIIEYLIYTIIVYMTTTNNEGLIPSLFFFYPTISCEGGKINFFLDCSREKAELLEAYLDTQS